MNDEVLKFFDACRRELTDRINPHCDFILLLTSSGCITKLHANKIMGISVDTEKTCKLLDILRKRSYAHLLTFVSCLNMDQPEVMMVLQKKAGRPGTESFWRNNSVLWIYIVYILTK